MRDVPDGRVQMGERSMPDRLRAALEAACARPVEPELAEPFALTRPATVAAPLIFSSPHSGRVYPQRFLDAAKIDLVTLRRSEDAFVDRLFARAAQGAPMLSALFPRAYLDLNREPYELDPRMFAEPLPDFANGKSLRVAAGLGTVPRVVADAREIYREKMSVEEALRRVESLYKPYHAALNALVDEALGDFGVAVLIDCHSMPTISARDPGQGPRAEKRRVDFVIGDRFGVSCDRRLADALEQALRGFGYNVHRNRPYAGGFITEHHGRPAARRHAIQIEVARGLYMDEATLTPNDRFEEVAERLNAAIGEVARVLPLVGAPTRLAAE